MSHILGYGLEERSRKLQVNPRVQTNLKINPPLETIEISKLEDLFTKFANGPV